MVDASVRERRQRWLPWLAVVWVVLAVWTATDEDANWWLVAGEVALALAYVVSYVRSRRAAASATS